MPKKPDFGQELDNGSEREASPIPNFETLYGGLNLPGDMRALAESRGYHYTADGLDIQRELTADDWHNILPEIKALQSSYQLIIGDWMLYGFEHGYVLSYEEMATLTGMQPQTIEVYTSICRNIPRLIRINPLKFSHYRLIAPLPEDERVVWIEFAVNRGLSFRTLQKLITLSQVPMLPESTSPDDMTIAPAVDAPTLSDEMEVVQEAVARPASTKEVRNYSRKFWKCIEADRLQDMEQDEMYLYMLFVQDKFAQLKRMKK